MPSLVDGGKTRPFLGHDAAKSGLLGGAHCRSAQTVMEDETFTEAQDRLPLHGGGFNGSADSKERAVWIVCLHLVNRLGNLLSYAHGSTVPSSECGEPHSFIQTA